MGGKYAYLMHFKSAGHCQNHEQKQGKHVIRSSCLRVLQSLQPKLSAQAYDGHKSTSAIEFTCLRSVKKRMQFILAVETNVSLRFWSQTQINWRALSNARLTLDSEEEENSQFWWRACSAKAMKGRRSLANVIVVLVRKCKNSASIYVQNFDFAYFLTAWPIRHIFFFKVSVLNTAKSYG